MTPCLANAFPELNAQLWEAIKHGDFAAGRVLQEKIHAVRDVLHLAPTIPSVHAVLEMRGIDAGIPRRPFRSLQQAVKDQIAAYLRDLEML